MSTNDHGSRWQVALIDRHDAAERQGVVALRRQAYAAAGEFAWHDLSTLDWTLADDQGAVLALWHDDGSAAGPSLLSTVRASVFQQLDAAEAFLEHALAGVGAQAPALVLSRAATAPAAHGRGLLALLRVAYTQALAQAGVCSVLAVVYDEAPRVRSMQAAGFSMTPPARSWDSEARALRPPLVAHLPQAGFESARQAALALAGGAPPVALQLALALGRGPLAAALRCHRCGGVPDRQPSAGASSRRASSCAMLSRAAQSST